MLQTNNNKPLVENKGESGADSRCMQEHNNGGESNLKIEKKRSEEHTSELQSPEASSADHKASTADHKTSLLNYKASLADHKAYPAEQKSYVSPG